MIQMGVSRLSVIAYTQLMVERHVAPSLPPCKILRLSNRGFSLVLEPIGAVLRTFDFTIYHGAVRGDYTIKVGCSLIPLYPPGELNDLTGIGVYDFDCSIPPWLKDESDIARCHELGALFQPAVNRYLCAGKELQGVLNSIPHFLTHYFPRGVTDSERLACTYLLQGKYRAARKPIISAITQWRELIAQKESRATTKEDGEVLQLMRYSLSYAVTLYDIYVKDATGAADLVRQWVNDKVKALQLG